MNTLEKINKVVKYQDGEDFTLKEYWKSALKEILIESPPKRFMGDSGWICELHTALVEGGVLSGGVTPCCEDWKECGGDSPCSFQPKKRTKDLNKEMEELIDLFFAE